MLNQIKIFELEKGDQENAFLLSGLAREVWTEHYTPIIGLAQVEYMLEKFQTAERILNDIAESGYRYFIAEDGGIFSGYCAAKPEPVNGALFLSKLYVKKSSRGQGISKLFLEKLLEIANENKLDYIWLTVNKFNFNSIEIYKKLGFSIVDELVTDIGNGYVMDDYKMRRDI